MPFFFENHPRVDYSLLKDKVVNNIKNPLVRYKLRDVLENNTVIYHTYEIEDNQNAQAIADKYYGDVTLDWVLFVVNDIIDPQFDWPLDYEPFINFIKTKYGSVDAAETDIHHYEWIYQAEQTLANGAVVDEIVYEVDVTTYNALSPDDRRTVTNFDYEVTLNDEKRKIQVLDVDYVGQLLDEVENIFK